MTQRVTQLLTLQSHNFHQNSPSVSMSVPKVGREQAVRRKVTEPCRCGSRGGEIGEFSTPPPFSEPPLFFFSLILQILKYCNIWFHWHYYKNSPPPPPHFKILDLPLPWHVLQEQFTARTLQKSNVDVLTESSYGTVAALGANSESWLANVDMTLSNAISDLSASAAVEQLSLHWKRQGR